MTKPLSEMSRSELIDEAVQLQQRNADLAAHVERISRKIDDAPPIDNPTIAKWECELIRLLGDSPENSLARLKAQWQAEILEVAKSKIIEDPHGDPVAKLEYMAYRMCRQAEEPNQ